MQARKQCLCKFYVFSVKSKNVLAFYIEKAQKGLCKAKFACVNDEEYSMSALEDTIHIQQFCFVTIEQLTLAVSRRSKLHTLAVVRSVT